MNNFLENIHIKRFIGIAVLILLIAAVPVTVLLSQQQQQYTQQAAVIQTICSDSKTPACSYTSDCSAYALGTLCEHNVSACVQNNVYVCNFVNGKKTWVYKSWTANGTCNFCTILTPSPKPSPTNTPKPSPSPNATPTNTPVPNSPTPTSTPVPTNTPVPSTTPPPANGIATDTFQRSNQTYWGTASDGHIWQDAPSGNAAFSIVSNAGQEFNANNTTSIGTLGPQATDVEVLIKAKSSDFTNNTIGVILRETDTNNYYFAMIDGSNLIIKKKVAGVATQISTAPFAASPNTLYDLRFKVKGTSLTARVWPDGTTEPLLWLTIGTDTSLTGPGYAGIRTLEQTGQTILFTHFKANLITGTSPTPTDTPTITPTVTPQTSITPPTFLPADVNHSGCVNLIDFNDWLSAFKGTPVPNTYPDMNGDGKVDLLDFNVWYTTIQTLFNNNPNDPRLCSK